MVTKLTRSVRPLVLVFLIVSTVLMVFIDSGSITFVVDDEWKVSFKTHFNDYDWGLF